jgi:hypothetical protein
MEDDFNLDFASACANAEQFDRAIAFASAVKLTDWRAQAFVEIGRKMSAQYNNMGIVGTDCAGAKRPQLSNVLPTGHVLGHCRGQSDVNGTSPGARPLDTTTRHQRTILRAGIIMCAASGHSVTRGARGYADAWGARCARESLGRPYDDRNHRRTPSASIRVDAWGLIASAPDPKVVQPFRSARQSRVPCIIYFSDPRWADAVGLCCYQRVVWLPLSGA